MRFPGIKSARSSRSTTSVNSDASTLLPDSPIVDGGLTVLHPPDDDGTALVDIITVHGLSGHPQNTWTNFDTQHYWPLQSLPRDVPRARIMTFGYSTTISPFNKSTAIVSDVAKQLISHLINKRTSEDQKQRPIIFVAHSLGGIVVKEFLHVASNTGHEDLAGSVCGILFLGTPHKGSHLASFMSVISDVVKSLLGRSADAIIEDLSTNSRHLLELDQLLRFKLARIDIYSFYELLPLKPLSRPVVERHSALLNLPSELEQIGLEADHRQMCRPPDRNHFVYETITQRVLSIMNRQIHKAQYASDLVEMTNDFASQHIATLTRQLHEFQLGSAGTPMVTVLQQTVSLQVSQAKRPGESPVSGFEGVLKSLPIHEIKSFVNGVQMLMERAKSLQDLILMTERENERRRAETRIEAERKANEERIRELMEENLRLKAVIQRQQHQQQQQQQLQQNALINPGSSFTPPESKARSSIIHRKTEQLSAVQEQLLGKPSGVRGLHGDRVSDPSDNVPENTIGHTESGEEDALPKETTWHRKRKKMSHYKGPRETFDREEDSDFPFWEEPDHFGPRTRLEVLPRDRERVPRRVAERARDCREPHLETGYLSTEFMYTVENVTHPPLAEANRPRTAVPDTVSFEIRKSAGPENTRGLRAETGPVGNTEPDLQPAKSVQQPSESIKTTQESKLRDNMEQMQEMVEKLSLLLEAGQQAMSAHEAGAILAEQS